MAKNQPEIIRYNVHERGRTHRGKDRNFDLRTLAALVNSPAVQERVRNRDMLGYFGHWQRMKFGMTPPETAIVDGKNVNIEPAIVTTYLRADANGNIEHQTEFLETAAGKIAARMHRSKAGGFSSAIHAASRGGVDFATLFGGFDYVMEPNVTTNRGYVFDGVDTPSEGSIFDFVMQDCNQSAAHMAALYDSLQSDHTMMMQAITRLEEENEQFLSILASAGGRALLDSVGDGRGAIMVAKKETSAFARTTSMFRTAKLEALEKLPDPEGDAILDQVQNHYGVA
jgi:hypothetical protein